MSQRLLFGVYPGGVTGDDSGGLASGPPDDQEVARVPGGPHGLQATDDRHMALFRFDRSDLDEFAQVQNPAIGPDADLAGQVWRVSRGLD